MLDLTGERYGHWLVVGFHSSDASGNKRWTCRCDCGTEKPVTASSLRQGTSQSCGCIPRGRPGRLNPNFRHGQGRTPTYNSWANMKQRCLNPLNPRWADYGGRGITVCERWLGWFGFDNFLADMGTRPEGTSLERIDNDGNYEPDNCKWATQAEQLRNTRRSRVGADQVLEIERLLGTGLTVWEIAEAVRVERHIVGYIVLTIEALRSEHP